MTQKESSNTALVKRYAACARACMALKLHTELAVMIEVSRAGRRRAGFVYTLALYLCKIQGFRATSETTDGRGGRRLAGALVRPSGVYLRENHDASGQQNRVGMVYMAKQHQKCMRQAQGINL